MTTADIRKRAYKILDAIGDGGLTRTLTETIDAMLQFADERVKAERERCAKASQRVIEVAQRAIASMGSSDLTLSRHYEDLLRQAIERGTEDK